MSEFTYENKKTSTPLEKYEWDYPWWEQTGNDEGKRILYIGDSISCGTRTVATKLSENKYLFDGFGSSKGIDNPYFAESVLLFARQQGKREAVLFNNGLHGWHLSTAEYKENYEKMINFLMAEFKNTPLVLLLTTDDRDNAEKQKTIVERNAVVLALAEKYALPVLDLYKISKEHADLHTDCVHFNPEGYKYIAEAIINKLDEILNGGK